MRWGLRNARKIANKTTTIGDDLSAFLGMVRDMQLSIQDPADLYSRHVASHTDAMRLAAGVSQTDFDRLYSPHLHRLCRTLQQSPLSRQGYPLPDGAVRFAVHSATLALQLAQASVFAPDEGAKARRELAPQYRFTVFASALGAAYIRVFRHVRFLVGGVPWNPLSEIPLYDFAAKISTYEIAWAPDDEIAPNPALDAMVFMAAFPQGFWERFHPSVLQDLAGGLSPAKNAVSETPMQRLLRTVTEKAFEQESLRIAQNVEASASIATLASSQDLIETPTKTLDQSIKADQRQGKKAANTADTTSSTKQANSSNPTPQIPLPVRQFFAAMRGDEKFPEMREQIKMTPENVRVPLKFLGRYGQKPTYAAQMLESSGLVIAKNAEHLVLRPEVASLLEI